MRAGTLTSLACGYVVGKDLEWGCPKFQSIFNNLLIQPLAPASTEQPKSDHSRAPYNLMATIQAPRAHEEWPAGAIAQTWGPQALTKSLEAWVPALPGKHGPISRYCRDSGGWANIPEG